MAVSKEILAWVRLQLDQGSVREVSSAIQQVTNDVNKLEAATKRQAASASSIGKRGLLGSGSSGGNYLPGSYGSFGGYQPALPPGRPQGQMALPPGYGTFGQNPLYTGFATQMSSSEIINIAPGIDVITNSVNNLADIFDLASARYSAFSEEVISKAKIVRQIMDELGMSVEEALSASNEMFAGGSRVPQNEGLDADVKKVLDMQQNLINYANGVPPFKNAAGDVDEALGENEMSAEDFNKMMGDTGDTMTDAAKKWKSFGAAFAGFQLRFVGQSLDRFARQMLTPITKYVEMMGIANKISAEWADAQTDVELATARIGRSMASVLLPAMQSLATTIERIAAFLEKNPEIARAIVSGAVLTAVVGNILRVAGTLLTATAALKYIVPQLFGIAAAGKVGALAGTAAATGAASAAGTAAAAGAGGAAGGMSIGAITSAILPYALPVIIPAVIAAMAVGAYKIYASSDLGQKRNADAAPGQLWAIIARGFGNLFGKEFGDKQFLKVAKFTGALNDTAEAADKAFEALGPGSEVIDTYISYLQQVKDLEESYEEERVSIIDQYGKQRADIEKQYAKELADIDSEIARLQSASSDKEVEYRKTIQNTTREYQTNEQQQLEDYYKRRQEIAEDYNINVRRAEEDHQRQMLQMKQDHDYKIMQLAGERDAFGIVQEEYLYERNRSRQEEEYSIEASRRSEDFARRMADLESQFAAERQRRMQEFKIRIEERQKEFQAERAAEIAALQEKRKQLLEQKQEDLELLEESHNEQLKLMADNKNKELKRMAASFNDSLRMLDSALLGERQTRIAYYTAMSKDLQSWLTSMQGQFSSNLPGYPSGKALGGYSSGLVNTGEEGYEFILRNSTTRHLEKAIGGKLTQDNILSLASSGAKVITIKQDFKFDSSLSESERAWFRRVAREEAENGLMSAIG